MEPKHGMIVVLLLFVSAASSEFPAASSEFSAASSEFSAASSEFSSASSEFSAGNLELTQKSELENAGVMRAMLERMAQLESAVSKHHAELVVVRNELRATRSELAEVRTQNSEETAKLRQEFERKVDAVKEQHAKEIDALKERIKMIEASEAIDEELEKDADSKELVEESHERRKDVMLSSLNKINPFKRQVPPTKTRRQEDDVRVAFFAKLSTNTEHFGYNQPIIFDNVTTNVGNYYDKHVGVFRAPVAGVYLFSTTITSYATNSGHFGFFINEGRETMFYNNGNENAWDETSQTIIVHLNKGDDVTVRSLDTDHGVTGGDHSLWSGVLLFGDDSQSIIVG